MATFACVMHVAFVLRIRQKIRRDSLRTADSVLQTGEPLLQLVASY